MVGKCINNSCSASFRNPQEGKLFSVDIEVGDKSNGHERVTEFFWLCAQCARKMNPRIDVAGKVVTLRLSMNQPGKQDGPLTRVN